MGAVITVSGAIGGIGTSTLAYAIALQCPGRALLIDAQLSGAPLDLLVGAESEPGTRWHQIHVASASIDPETVLSALPHQHGIAVLSSSRLGLVQPIALAHLVDATRTSVDLVVIDIASRSSAIDLLQPDEQVVTLTCTIEGVGGVLSANCATSRLVVMRSVNEDFLPTQIGKYLPNPQAGVVDHDRSVWLALRNRIPLPAKSSVMRTARRVVESARDAA